MKYTVHVILLIILSVLTMDAESVYYYFYQEKIYLELNPEKVAIAKMRPVEEWGKNVYDFVDSGSDFFDSRFDIRICKANDYADVANCMELPCVKDNNCNMYVGPYINVKLLDANDVQLLYELANEYNLGIHSQNRYMPNWWLLYITPETNGNALTVSNALVESGKVSTSYPELLNAYSVERTYDSRIDEQWALYNWDYPEINMNIYPAWSYATGRGIKISIVDTGVDINHEDLAANVGMTYDTETQTSPCQIQTSYPDHGTHCAGIAAAVGDNGKGISGVAPNATLMAASVLFGQGSVTSSHLADGINWSWHNGADVISCSWSSGPNSYSSMISDAIDSAVNIGRNGKGCVMTFAVGNNSYPNTIEYPAKDNKPILAVTAIDIRGRITSFANRGPGIFCAAPGKNILSTIPNNSYSLLNGTSMATPAIAGIAALILERNPNLTVHQVKDIIRENCVRYSWDVRLSTDSLGRTVSLHYGYGVPDAYQCVINTPRP